MSLVLYGSQSLTARPGTVLSDSDQDSRTRRLLGEVGLSMLLCRARHLELLYCFAAVL